MFTQDKHGDLKDALVCWKETGGYVENAFILAKYIPHPLGEPKLKNFHCFENMPLFHDPVKEKVAA